MNRLVICIIVLASALVVTAGCSLLEPQNQEDLAAAQQDLEAAVAHLAAVGQEVQDAREALDAKFQEVQQLIETIQAGGLTPEAAAATAALMQSMNSEITAMRERYESAQQQLQEANAHRLEAAEKVDRVSDRSGVPEWLIGLGLGANTIFSLILRGLPSKGLGGALVQKAATESSEHHRRAKGGPQSMPTA
ncbi:MAG: hypothetical protein EYC70_00525 [Planctomycetota bacterium]|nr:MAG: hypothetical protein EYC70_00525 [Planctomycetota bacterium]